MEIARGSLLSELPLKGPDDRDPSGVEAALPSIRVELVTARAMLQFETAWSDLISRAMEPNVFLDPGFALPLLQHVRFSARPEFLLAWEESGPTSFGKLIGLLPIEVPSPLRVLIPRLVWGFHHKQVALGTPLLDSARGPRAFEAMIAELSRMDRRLSGLILTAIPADGAFCNTMRAVCAETDRSIAVFGEHQRAVLIKRAFDTIGNIVSMLSAKRRKELRRKSRRLEDHGALVYRSATTPAEVRAAAEQFLALEYGGWKGRRKSALLSSPSLATFTRTMTRLLAYEGRCRIDSLEVLGEPVAMGIVLTAGTRAHFWKTTFDERFSQLSPGVQFVLALTQAQADGTHTLTDSCAVPDHPMIDRIWPDRMAIADFLIEILPSRPSKGNRASRFAAAIRYETLRRQARHAAKAAFMAVTRKKAAAEA